MVNFSIYFESATIYEMRKENTDWLWEQTQSDTHWCSTGLLISLLADCFLVVVVVAAAVATAVMVWWS